jgi:DNA-binding transcriptional LysR family regulator
MPAPIDTKLLRTFVTIVETQSFTRSGEQLGLTQPAISMQMQRLEGSLGRVLFDRTRQGVHLTREGEILLQYGRRLLALSDEAKARVAQPGLQGVVRFGTCDDYANILLPDVFRRFSASHPNVQVDLVCGNGRAIERKLHDGAVDLALIGRLDDAPGCELLRTEDLVWIGADRGQTLAQPIALASFPEGCVCRTAMAHALDRSNLDWRVAFSSNNIGAIHAAVRSGIAITAVERSLVPDGVQMLGQADGLPKLHRVNIVLKANPGRLSPALDALAREIRLGLMVSVSPAQSLVAHVQH